MELAPLDPLKGLLAKRLDRELPLRCLAGRLGSFFSEPVLAGRHELANHQFLAAGLRSEERRGGEEGRSRWAPDHSKKKYEQEMSHMQDTKGLRALCAVEKPAFTG